MRTAIIVNTISNEPLLRFTETKLFFDANNQGINFVDDCVVVNSFTEAEELAGTLESAVILETGDFLTTTFRRTHSDKLVCYATGPDVIKFDSNTYVGVKGRCQYKHGSKQLYIIENFLKVYLRSRSLVYLDNTEDINVTVPCTEVEHLVGLASGWKTIMLAEKIGFGNLKSITVYDYNIEQLNHAQWVHANVAAATCPQYKNTCGTYNPMSINTDTWINWNKYPVKFEQINLFDTPVFPENSLIWVSNAFRYEPNIFDFGWETCKNKHRLLTEANKHSYII